MLGVPVSLRLIRVLLLFIFFVKRTAAKLCLRAKHILSLYNMYYDHPTTSVVRFALGAERRMYESLVWLEVSVDDYIATNDTYCLVKEVGPTYAFSNEWRELLEETQDYWGASISRMSIEFATASSVIASVEDLSNRNPSLGLGAKVRWAKRAYARIARRARR